MFWPYDDGSINTEIIEIDPDADEPQIVISGEDE